MEGREGSEEGTEERREKEREIGREIEKVDVIIILKIAAIALPHRPCTHNYGRSCLYLNQNNMI